MKRQTVYQHPTTYEEIVQWAASTHNRRLKELKSAEKHIRAMREDLSYLAKTGSLYGVGAGSMFLVDVTSELTGRYTAQRKRALHIDGGIFEEYRDRLANGFFALGWQVEHTRTQIASATLILRKPKTQTRVHLYVSKQYVDSLGIVPAREVA